MYEYLKYYNIPVTIVLTKVDKVSASKKERNLKIIKDTLNLAVGDDYVLFSSVTKNGRDEILKILENFIIETI
jgi:GTP-binding protein